MSYGITADLKARTVENCLQMLGQEFPDNAISCFTYLGNQFELWKRHPMWNKGVRFSEESPVFTFALLISS